MSANESVISNLSRLFGKRLKSSSKRSRFAEKCCLAIETLEKKNLLAGIVSSQSTFDIDLFASNLAEQAGAGTIAGLQVEGFSYAISQRDTANPWGPSDRRYSNIVDVNGDGIDDDGVARHGWDNNVNNPTSPHAFREQEIASVAKIITATAVLRVWQEQTANVNTLSQRLDDPIIDYLPSAWTPGSFFSQITIRELLTHTSGLQSGSGGGYTYSSLQALAENGNVFFAKTPNYWTINYAYFRVALPYMWANMTDAGLNQGETGFRDQLEAADNGQPIDIDYLPDGVWDQIQDDWNLNNDDLGSGNTLQIGADRLTASAYKSYVIQYILPAAISNPQTKTNDFPTLLYQFPAPDGVPGRDTGDLTLSAGPRSWFLSARDLELVMSAVRHDDSVLLPPTRGLMNDEFLGWLAAGTNGTNSRITDLQGDHGQYYGHAGGNFRAQVPGQPTGTTATRNNTIAMAFPEGIQASMFMNSQLGPAFGSAFNPTSTASNATVTMRDAFDNAWTHVVYAGDPGILASANDTFVLQLVPGTTNWIELFHDDLTTPVMQRRIDTISSLEIRGLGGDDTLTILDLPAALNLNLTFTGGNGNDTVNLDVVPAGVNLVVDGGAGNDTVNVGVDSLSQIIGNVNFIGGTGSDSMNFQETRFINSWNFTINSTALFRNGIGHVASYSGIETLRLTSGTGNDLIRVLSSVIGTKIEIDAGMGNNHIVVGGGNASANINDSVTIAASAGNDKLTIDDRNGIAAHDFYVFQETYFQSGFIPVISWDAAAPVDEIVLLANPQDSTTNIQGVLSDVTLIVRGLAGDDVLNIHASSPNSLIHFSGGVGNDRLELAPTTNLLDSIQGTVAVRGNHGANDRVVVNDQAFQGRPGRQYRVNGQNIDLVNSTFGNLYVAPDHGLERLDINAGEGNDVFDVRSWAVSTLLYLTGNSGSDELRVASISRNVDSIVGDLEFNADSLSLPGVPSPDNDILTIYDDQRGGIPSYSINVGPNLRGDFVTPGFDLTHFGVEQVTMFANDAGNYVNVAGAPSLLHKASYFLNVGGGNDTIVVRAPAAATVHAIGGDGFDILLVNGTPSDDYVTLSGNRMDLNQLGSIATTTVIRDSGIEYSRVNTDDGQDVLVIEGQAGLNEDITIQTTGVGSGWVTAAPFDTMHYFNLEDAAVNGNAGDNDTFQILGTAGDDSILINPVGLGTTVQPFVQMLQANGGSLLKLRDATNVGTPVIRGGGGSDTFRVSLFPSGNSYPIRDMRLDGGEDAGNTDNDHLIVSYNSNIFSLVSPPAAPENGLLQFDNNSDILDIVFENFEALSV